MRGLKRQGVNASGFFFNHFPDTDDVLASPLLGQCHLLRSVLLLASIYSAVAKKVKIP